MGFLDGFTNGMKKAFLTEVEDNSSTPIPNEDQQLLDTLSMSNPIPQNTTPTDVSQGVKDLIAQAYDGIGDATALNQLSGLMKIFGEMPIDVRRQKASETLSNFGISIDAILEDGERRADAIQTALDEVKVRITDRNADLNAEIEDYRQKIQAAQQELAENAEYLNTTTEGMTAELTRLSTIIEFAKSIIPDAE